MAFHVACPITCQRICSCSLGFPGSLHSANARIDFLLDVHTIDQFLNDPSSSGISASPDYAAASNHTFQVLVPKVVALPLVLSDGGVVGGNAVDEVAPSASTRSKRIALQKKAADAMVAAEDYARRFESGDLSADASRGQAGEDQSNVNVMCRLCFSGENEGSEKARRMLPCKKCGKKYHRSCLKSWAQHRDLFHWSSWVCPSCRICEVCLKTGDPNKFMFCKRCDAAHHCYCQKPSHKNVNSGPYLCPRHTRCHSCGSTAPGNGLSVRWFLGYTCCDACGRLFSKGNYCPACLKVYRDSESTPMVCCDVCQHWVHCKCDNISDEKYRQFQVDGNLQYKCSTCRGECYQVKGIEDAIRELWRRRDEADCDLVSSLRAAAGLPTQEEIFSISLYSDDEENGPMRMKDEHGRSLKFSLKGLVEKSPKKTEDYVKKSSNKKNAKKKEYEAPLVVNLEYQESFEGHNNAQSFGYSSDDNNNDDRLFCRKEGLQRDSFPVAGSLSHSKGICSINQPGVMKHKFVDDVMVNDEDRAPRAVRLENVKPYGLDTGEDFGKHSCKSKDVRGKKIVISLGRRKKNVTDSPMSDASNCQREKDLMTPKGDRTDGFGQLKLLKVAGKEGNLLKLGEVKPETSDVNIKFGRGGAEAHESITQVRTQMLLGKRNSEGNMAAAGSLGEVRGSKELLGKPAERSEKYDECNDDYGQTTGSHLPKDIKSLLKFKLQKPTLENQNSPHPEEEKNSIKGQRSKRRRPSPLEKTSFNESGLMDEIMDANWILKKLGKDAIGKRVEVHQSSDNSWHKGVVTNITEGKSL
ncbi:uncharacterized protein LOC121241203 isoform X2 [Juglans microcarpa x Juglans regia]|uniref:uncharacterized protein LOC121241203 isoform X2 n=1 Tax=Juglans microcarpa x Juglans regia TaxID=2249226 RepID=UPI001B7F4775|nr:uncharacterized protein LOC121241203 isoform X2 [Juglans microcarpa x Juglans regia]